MKDQLLQDLSALHLKVAALKVYDHENATLLGRYANEFKILLAQLVNFAPEKFKSIASAYNKTSVDSYTDVVDLHDDTDNNNGFYDSVANLNNNINDSVEIINSI